MESSKTITNEEKFGSIYSNIYLTKGGKNTSNEDDIDQAILLSSVKRFWYTATPFNGAMMKISEMLSKSLKVTIVTEMFLYYPTRDITAK